MIWLLLAAVVIVPPLLVGWAICRVAADADRAMDNWSLDHDICAGCDGHLEFDSERQSICVDCGSTTVRRSS